MGLVVNKSTKQILRSVNTPDYDPTDWLINPNTDAVINVPDKYWKIVNEEVVEMTSGEKTVYDNSVSSYQDSFKVKNYTDNILVSETYYETDNEDGTFSGKSREILYSYNASKTSMLGTTENTYNKNGDILTTISLVYSTVKDGNQIFIVEAV